jgi:glycosyl transferase family 2/glycosyl transferase family 1
VAIHNYYAGQSVAETEFARRIHRAACRLGWEAAEVKSSVELNEFKPDFVLALHFRTPKLTQFPTYGSMVTPPSFFTDDHRFINNILSYDGYLCSSELIQKWLKDILYLTRKTYFIAPWYTTSHLIPYSPPQIGVPRLLYAGTNWDGPRFGELFGRLDVEPYLDIYGPQTAWSHIRRSYRGTLPFDGVSILNALNAAGVGLCLHREEHCAAGAPSSRIFEIAASGAVAICQEHPFIRDTFQDSVLYLERTDDPVRLTQQISEYMQWIAQNPEDALKLSRRAYDIFSQNYTLEKLLADLAPPHQQLVERKKFTPSTSPKILGDKSAQFIVRVGDREAAYVERALESISCQSYSRVGAIVVQYREVPNLSRVLDKYNSRLPVQLVHSSCTGCRSTQLWDGLRAVSSEYFGILDDDDLIHPNHVGLLVRLLDEFEDIGVAYSGAIRIWEADPAHGHSELPVEPAELMYFEPFDLGRLVTLDNFITSNAFVARSSLLKGLGNDPQLPLLEDLFLLLFLCRKTNFVFTFEATCEFCWRGTKTDNSVLMDRQTWAVARKRIENLLWKEGFHSIQQVGLSSLSQLESRLTDTLNRLTEIETRLTKMDAILTQTKVKADGMAIRLDRYLNSPIFNVIRRVRRKLFRLPPPEA